MRFNTDMRIVPVFLTVLIQFICSLLNIFWISITKDKIYGDESNSNRQRNIGQ